MASSATKRDSLDLEPEERETDSQAHARLKPAAGQGRAALPRVLWESRRFLLKVAAVGFLVSAIVAFLIPKTYTASEQLMPPDSQSQTGMAMMAALASQGGAGSGGLTGLAGDLLGLKNSGALFIGILRSQTAQDRLVEQFGLKSVYGVRLTMDARSKLDQNTVISEDRKSGIISIGVIDRDPQRAAAIANAYVVQLNTLVSELSTSAAHRERVFLEERLVVVKRDLDDATNQLAQFSSKSNTLDIQTEGRALLDAAGALSGQLIAAQSELEGLRQIYAEDNARVRALNARVSELRTQLARLGGSAGGSAGGTAGSSNPTSDASGSLPYPSIRSLPLLGAKYADYFRRAKIQETVFQLLTEQSELAKVEEAKETPSVKILDPAQVPERKSAPARLLIMLLGSLLAFSGAVVWVLGANQWSLTDPADPRKILMEEIAATCKDPKSWFAPESAKPHADVTAEKL
jgi:uncharacterized protein involved in exopolysaccharide biosynthesis